MLERRRRSTKRLTTEEGDRLARIAKVYSIALDIYRDPEKVRDFLRRPHMMLDTSFPSRYGGMTASTGERKPRRNN